jgi:two-component system, chemotaxis family, CheB/CheR fusion protein
MKSTTGKKNKTNPPATTQDFPIVGIGASAGGLNAFKAFIKAIPVNSGMAYVIVQHLDPKHESLLPEILSKCTKMPVHEITDDIHLAPDTIYVIPENKTLTSIDGVLKLTPREKIKPNLPIDTFFVSLAEVHLNLAVGVILSGTGSDGTLGLKAIKAHGGITFAQDQKSSGSGAMPQSAVTADVVDFILPPEKIPKKLLEISHTYTANLNKGALPKNDEAAFQQIITFLSQYSGVDFTYYKQSTIRRRVVRRMAITKNENLRTYLKVLRKDKKEQDSLFNDMLIPVTSFYRDTATFENIKNKVFPALLKNKSSSGPFRIWSAGCSTGEEAYSLAISLHQLTERSGRQIQIFASDISPSSIAKARTGIYHKSELKNISPDILKTYFKKINDDYQVNREIRDLCVFAVHNFLKDPPFARMDMISCRNVLIYMDSFLQKKALTTFHYALKDTGLLLLGKSEATGGASELFSPFSPGDKLYSRKAVPGRFIAVSTERKSEISKAKENKSQAKVPENDYKKITETILLSKYTPASVIINDQMDIVHIHGVITPFLEPSQGKPSFNLFKMAKESLAFELRNTLHKAKSGDTSARKDGIPILINEKKHIVSFEITPLDNTIDPHFLITFHSTLVPEKTSQKVSSQTIDHKMALNRIEQLEKELSQTREDMRSITEDQEAANEELQSANEELLSSSEELQSLNEELETSKEETHSSNEELTIVNQELVDKQDQMNASRVYAEAIIDTVREPLVVLDKALRIKTINSAFIKKFNIDEPECEGKFIFEIQNRLFDNSTLRSLLERVLPLKTELNDYEIIINMPIAGESNMLVNARQIITDKDKEQLILIAIEDITERKITEQKMKDVSEGLEVKIQERTASLKKTNLQLEQFSHTASHEFQEPLRKIVTFSKMLQKNYKTGKSEEIKSYLDKIETASIRMTKLIKDMLDFASVVHSEKLLEKTDLNDIVRNVLFDFELLIDEKKAKIIMDELPEIEAVPFQMNQLFYDIIGNALKFSKRDVSPVIEISVSKYAQEKIKAHPNLDKNLRYYEIVVKDNGIGFDQKYSQQIFMMFQKLSAGNTYGGTGIGLALCKKIVTSYSGEIFATSKENKGTEIHIILPKHQPRIKK